MAVVQAYGTKAGKRYRVRYRTPDNRQTDKRGFKTKAEATRFANTVEVAKLKGEYVNPSDARKTLDDLGQAWSDSRPIKLVVAGRRFPGLTSSARNGGKPVRRPGALT